MTIAPKKLFMAASSREAGRNFPTLVPQSAGPNNGKNDAEELDFVLVSTGIILGTC